MNAFDRFLLSLVAGLVILMCLAGAFVGVTVINSPQDWALVFADPKTAGEWTRLAAASFVLFQSLMGIVFAGSLRVLLSIDKGVRERPAV